MNEWITIAVLVVLTEGTASLLGAWYAKRYVRGTMSEVADLLVDIFEKPAVSRAMGVLGKRSGEVRGDSAMAEQMALDIINSEKFEGLKLAAKGIGIDLDEYIEEHGASKTIRQAISLGKMLGIDVETLISGGLSGLNTESSHTVSETKNPYLQ